MSPSKTLFQRDKDMASWWSAIAHDDRFKKVLIFVRSDFLELGLDGAALKGAKEFERVLSSISDTEDSNAAFIPGPGLNHDIDKPDPEPVKANRKKN